jgi:hypothetical protein
MSRIGLPDFNVLQPSHPVSGWVAISDRSRLEGQLFHISYPVNAFAWLSRYSPLHGWAALSISITFQRQTLKCQPMMEALKLRLTRVPTRAATIINTFRRSKRTAYYRPK